MYCRNCGAEISDEAVICPKCGTTVNEEKLREMAKPKGQRKKKDKVVAGLLAIFLGGLGIHRFYLGQWWGIFYLIFCWTYVPSIIGLIEGIVFLVSSEEKFDEKYNNPNRY